MFKSYESFFSESAQPVKSEQLIQEYEGNYWVSFLLNKYPIEHFSKQLETHRLTRQQYWKAIHSVHNNSLAQGRAQTLLFLKKWAKTNNLIPSDEAQHQHAILKLYRRMLVEVMQSYGTWLSDCKNIAREDQADHSTFILEYWKYYEKTYSSTCAIVLSYHWLKEQAPRSDDPQWHIFFECIEETRLSNHGNNYHDSHSIWGQRTWSCFLGISERITDLVTYLRSLIESKKELMVWLEKEHGLSRGSAAQQDMKALLARSENRDLHRIWESRVDYPELTLMLGFMDSQSYAALTPWSDLLLSTGQEAIALPFNPSDIPTYLQSWEESFTSQAQALKQIEESKKFNPQANCEQYCAYTIEQFLSAQAQPTALMYAVYTQAIWEYYKQKGLPNTYTMLWEPALLHRYEILSEADRIAHKETYLRHYQDYFYALSDLSQHIDLTALKAKLEAASEQQVDDYFHQGVELGLYSQHVLMATKNIKIIRIMSILHACLPAESNNLSLEQFIAQRAFYYDTAYHNIVTTLHQESDMFMPKFFDIKMFSRTHSEHSQSVGRWLLYTKELILGQNHTSSEELSASCLTWASLVPFMSKITGFEDQFFRDLKAIARGQQIDLEEQLQDLIEAGRPSSLSFEQIQQNIRILKKHINLITQSWYQNYPNPQGQTYLITKTLSKYLFEQWSKDLSCGLKIQRWEEYVYIRMIKTIPELIIKSDHLNTFVVFCCQYNLSQAIKALIPFIEQYFKAELNDTAQLMLMSYQFNKEMCRLLYRSSCLNRMRQAKISVSILRQEKDKQKAQDFLNYFDAQFLFECLRQCDSCDERPITLLIEQLSFYDAATHKISKNAKLTLQKKYSFTSIMSCLHSKSFKYEQLRRIVELYFKYFLNNQHSSFEQQTTWFRQIQNDACDRILDLKFFEIAVNKIVYLNNMFCRKNAKDSIRYEIPLQNQNCTVLAIMWEAWSRTDDSLVRFEGSLLQHILNWPSPMNRFMTEKEKIFLEKLTRKTIIFDGSSRDEIHYAFILEKTTCEYYAPLLELFLRQMVIPHLIWPYLGKQDFVDMFLKNYLTKEYISCLKQKEIVYSYDSVLHRFIQSKLISTAAAQSFYEAIKYKQWAAFLSETTGLLPLEECLLQPCDEHNKKQASDWLRAGHPLERPEFEDYVELAKRNGYHDLLDTMHHTRLSQEKMRQQNHNNEASDLYYGEYYIAKKLLLAKQSSQKSSPLNFRARLGF